MVLLLQNLIILLILLLIFYISRKKIEQSVCFIVFLLPAYLLRTEIFGVPTTTLELGIYILFIIWLARTYRSGRLGEAASGIFSDHFFATGVFLLMSGALISTIFSVDLRASAGIFKGWFFDPLLFFIVLVSAIKTYGQKMKVLTYFFASGAVVGAASLVYWFIPSLAGVSYDGRLHAFYASPNYLAMYLAPAILVGVWGFAFSLGLLGGGGNFFSGRYKYFWLIPSAVMIAAVYLTFSYAAWVSLALSVFFLIFVLGKYFKVASATKKKIIFSAFILFVFIAAVLGQSGKSKLENLENMAHRSSFNSRLMIWRAAWEIGKDNPVFGIGPGNFQRYYLDYQKRFLEPYLEWAVPEPHNVFLAFWLQTGFLGLAGFIALIFWFFKKTRGLLNKTGDTGSKGLAMVLCSIMVYTLLHGLTDTPYWKNDLAIIFWMLLGLTAAEKTIPER